MEQSASLANGRPPGFSLFRGGFLYRLWLRMHLCGRDLDLVHRRIIAIAIVTWFPLLLLSLADGTAITGRTKIPFLHDIAVQARFLVGLPILLYGEMVAHRRIGPRIDNFLLRDLIVGSQIPKFHAVIEKAHRVRDSIWLEVGVAILVYTIGMMSWRSQMLVGMPSWFADPDGIHLNLTLAGYWFAFVSVPIFQFILVRWYARYLIWFWLIWRLSRLKLDIVVSHPDRAGGLGFLARATYSFGFLLFVQGLMLSGLIANLALHDGRNLLDFRAQAIVYTLCFAAAAFAPLATFIPPMVDAKRRGLSAYGLLAMNYTRDFGAKWIDGKNEDNEVLLGTTDIQSLADLGNSFQMVRQMRLAPFGWQAVAWLAGVMVIPLVPLLLFILSPEELLDQLLKIIL